MEETMTEWRDRKRGMDPNSAGTQGLTGSGGPVTIPLGSGEWDEGLGIPMCVVCQGVRIAHPSRGGKRRISRSRIDLLQQADKIEKLEKDHGWHEEEFDFILQFMRTILLKRTCHWISQATDDANAVGQTVLHLSTQLPSWRIRYRALFIPPLGYIRC